MAPVGRLGVCADERFIGRRAEASAAGPARARPGNGASGPAGANRLQPYESRRLLIGGGAARRIQGARCVVQATGSAYRPAPRRRRSVGSGAQISALVAGRSGLWPLSDRMESSSAGAPGRSPTATAGGAGRRDVERSFPVRWMFAVVVVHRVAEPEHRAQTTTVGAPLERPDLARVGVRDDVGLAVGATGEKPHGLVGTVHELVAALLASKKRDNVAWSEVAPPVWRAQARAPVQHDHELLLGEVVVVGVSGFTGRQLPQAQPEPLATRLAAETSAKGAEAWALAWLVEERLVDIDHAASLRMLSCGERVATARKTAPLDDDR
jgi:hypothetical protein